MKGIKLFSSDLNGTLIKQHTMSDMILVYKGKNSFNKANAVFKKQTNGIATMKEAFSIAGPLTSGITLRQVIEYTKNNLDYSKGFKEFIDYLYRHKIPLIINSTGYSVTIYTLRDIMGVKIDGNIGNFLIFGFNGDKDKKVPEEELIQRIKKYPSNKDDISYDIIKATGEIKLGIADENEKARLIIQYAKRNFNLEPYRIVHMGDTIGDSKGIYEIAKAGGLGIAFNPNEALKKFIEKIKPPIRKNIIIIKDDLRKVINYL